VATNHLIKERNSSLLRGSLKILAITIVISISLVNNANGVYSGDFRDGVPKEFLGFTFTGGSGHFGPTPSFSRMPSDQSGDYAVTVSLPVCQDSNDLDCIVGVELIEPSGAITKGIFDEYVPAAPNPLAESQGIGSDYLYDERRILYSAQPSRKIPDSSRGGIWHFDGLQHSHGNRYLISYTVRGEMTNQQSPLAATSTADWNSGGSGVRITPVAITSGREFPNLIPGKYWSSLSANCFPGKTAADHYCLTKSQNISSPRFSVKVRLSLTTGFLSNRHWQVSRTIAPRISSKITNEFTELTYTGTSMFISASTALIPRTTEGYKIFRQSTNMSYKSSGARNAQLDINDMSGFSQWSTLTSSGTSGADPGAFGLFQGFDASGLEIFSSKSDSMWEFQSATSTSREVGWLWPCSKTPTLSGVTASNATVMRPSPPTWNPEEQTLDFQIASAHTDEYGEKAKGFYGLVVSSEIAKCLWGNDATTARASVSMISSSGEIQITTLAASIRDGFFIFDVSGFHFSSGTIRLQMARPSTSIQTPALTKTTIKCVKGKVVKKVTAINPKCPAGYKKK
jgi:hypothetical protein